MKVVIGVLIADIWILLFPIIDNWTKFSNDSKFMTLACMDPEGQLGGPDPLENHKSIGFLSNTGPDPL